MKKLIILLMLILLGCEGTIDSGTDGSSIATVNIGLSHRTYEYLELYDSNGYFYKIIYTKTEIPNDTIYVDVPAGETTMKFHDVMGDIDETYNIITINPVADSIYRFKF